MHESEDTRRAEAALVESQRMLATLIANLPGLAYRCRNDRDWSVEFVSDGCLPLTGHAPGDFASGRVHFGSLIHPDDADAVWNEVQAALAARRRFTLTYRIICADGTLKWVWEQGCGVYAADGTLLHLEGFVTDISERVAAEQARGALEAQLARAQQHEALGRLAGGIAHDFNNLLTVFLVEGSLLLDGLPPGSPVRNHAEHLLQVGKRAAGLTQQLLAVSRRQITQPRPLDLNAEVREIVGMLERVIGEQIALRVELAAGAPRVCLDPAQVTQVLLNLALNGRDAMPQGGRLVVSTRVAECDEAFVREHGGQAPAPHACLSVSDSGPGLDEAARARVFEPYSGPPGASRGPGSGSGLGLATVHGIVKQSGGMIRVLSEPGRGACFEVYWPLTQAQAPAAPGASDAPPPAHEQLILVVDDEEAIRDVTVKLLVRQGYRVAQACNGMDALQLVRNGLPFPALLLTDVVMPVIDGRELARRVRQYHPATRVLYMSGYTGDILETQGPPMPGERVVAKPFLPEDLLAAIRVALSGAAPATPRPQDAQAESDA